MLLWEPPPPRAGRIRIQTSVNPHIGTARLPGSDEAGAGTIGPSETKSTAMRMARHFRFGKGMTVAPACPIARGRGIEEP